MPKRKPSANKANGAQSKRARVHFEAEEREDGPSASALVPTTTSIPPIVLFEDGDLIIKGNDTDPKSYLVSSQVFRNACQSAFDRMFPDGIIYSPGDPPSMTLTADTESIGMALYIIHALNEKLPEKLSLGQLDRLERLCSQWNLVPRMKFFAAIWLSGFDLTKSNLYDLNRYTRLSRRFGLSSHFRAATKTISRRNSDTLFDLLGDNCALDAAHLKMLRHQQANAKRIMHSTMTSMHHRFLSGYACDWVGDGLPDMLLVLSHLDGARSIEDSAALLIRHLEHVMFSLPTGCSFHCGDTYEDEEEQDRKYALQEIRGALEQCRGLCLHCAVSKSPEAGVCVENH
ncbi:hypothetical protein ANO11243_060180 [Dothideomycetidae sp. 11243]|nr:hypothetical protein ANO11243_060180 [fungal sp. No.11243]